MKQTRRSVLFLVLPALLAVAGSGCASADVTSDQTANVSAAATAANPDVYPFAMGATNLQVGDIRIWNDADNVYVQYAMTSGYELGEAHVCIATAPFPWTPPGQCPYQQDPMPPDTTSWTFTIPYADLGLTAPACDTVLYLQVHSAVLDATTGEKVGSAYGGTFKGRLAYVTSCDPPPSAGCTYTQGYWKTHPSAWPVSELAIGGVTYSRSQLVSFLKTAPKGDASIIMGHQLVAALLNQASGAGLNPEVIQAIADAQAWMAANKDADGRLPYGIRPTPEGDPNPATWDEAINIGAVLDLFNQGFDGPPHCP